MNPVLAHFERHDPIMHSLAQTHGIPVLNPSSDPFRSLCESIVSQQLSVRAADTIFLRFLGLFPGGLTPGAVYTQPEESLRACGLSNAKTRYIRDLALHISNGTLELPMLAALDDEPIIAELTAVKGIGRWTAEMFLIFSLGREDIFSYGDLGLRRAIQQNYHISEKKLIPRYLEPIVTVWKPYRTYASRLLWKSLELPK